MPIEFKDKKFHLYNKNLSYIIKISEHGDVLGAYFGARTDLCGVDVIRPVCNSFSPYPYEDDASYTPGIMPSEYPVSNGCDYRTPALDITLPDGSKTLFLKYKEHKILNGKPKINGLPSVYTENDAEAQTLVITEEDNGKNITVNLYYTVFEDFNAICRHAQIINNGENPVFLNSAQSVCADFPEGDYEYIHLCGAHTREKHIERNAVHQGSQGFESRRGASGHTENPFLAFFEKGANEKNGNVYGFSLVYSGNHKFEIELENCAAPRVTAGINPFSFRYKLDKEESFSTPEAVLVFSQNGLGEMSQTYHKLYRTRLCRGKFKNLPRPILINNWEATYFNFDREKLIKIADTASKIGIELFVLDDGWFGKRDSSFSSLGDWFANEEKLGGNLKSLADEINKKGMKFGLWFEPEMISEDSNLYRAHPDWAIGIPNRPKHYARHQLVLDYTRSDVRDYIVKTVSNVLDSANIEYVKWDMNRNITDAFSQKLAPDRQGEFYHRYILGLYEVLEKITSSHPNILFESCSGGGGRCDPGMLYYMPQCWASDNTDAVERLYIQYGSSLVYPMSSVGTHISASPNHQLLRTTSLSMRACTAMNGAFGYELDLSALGGDEIEEMKKQVEFYKRIRNVITTGTFYRLVNPFEKRQASWQYVSENKEKSIVYYSVANALSCQPIKNLKLRGLDENAEYKLGDTVYTGRTLMNYGIFINDIETESFNRIIEIEKVTPI